MTENEQLEMIGIINRIKSEAYKEFAELIKAELRDVAKIDWQGNYYYLVGEALFDNLLKELVSE